LEVDNIIPKSHIRSLEKLLGAADVHILSYVKTKKRENNVKAEFKELQCYGKLSGVHFCYEKTGPDGKMDWCSWLNATAIMDDNADICLECYYGSSMLVMAIATKWERHTKLPNSNIWPSFPDAVEGFLEI
jgi:hypothetical protein